MAILVSFRENKKRDSDIDVIGRCTDGQYEGMVCFLARGTGDASRYIDQEITCDVVKVNEKSLVVKPVSRGFSQKVDPSSVFSQKSGFGKKTIDPDSLFKI